MKLSAETMAVLKNYSAINKNIMVYAGNTLRTKSLHTAVVSKAKVAEEFPKDFAIFELNRLINCLSLFDDPEIEFGNHDLTISSGPNKITYAYANPEILVIAKNEDVKITDWPIKFKVTKDVINALEKAGRTLGLTEIAFVGENGKLILKAIDVTEKIRDEYVIEIGETSETFKAVIKIEHLNLLPKDYNVGLSKNPKISKWESEDGVVYWIAMVQNNSTFE